LAIRFGHPFLIDRVVYFCASASVCGRLPISGAVHPAFYHLHACRLAETVTAVAAHLAVVKTKRE
jgi:hypothetical protein